MQECLQKRHCKDNLRFLMMRETDEPLEPGSAAVMYFFVKRLKSADHPLQEKCEDAAAVVSLDDSPVASRQTFGRKKCNAADWDGEKEEVMPKKKRRPTDSIENKNKDSLKALYDRTP
ncbi:unnamed protein product, partial [Mesorhabditis belari]|uniref:Uncharacterized protein n=1 Tax=Mesorhabditis belari TaxID=2138241 RepID=A0AAF3EI98_9BILA